LTFPEPAKTPRRCGCYGIMNKRTNWYGIRIFVMRGETCIAGDIRRSNQFYAKVEIARSSVAILGVALTPFGLLIALVNRR